MRYIDLDGLLRKRNRWGHRQELWKNKTLQKDFRDYFHNKCWYTEVILVGQDAPIEHFRPKKEVKQFETYRYNAPLEHCGYYWLANDPRNYRLSCVYANRKTGDGGKGCFFPLTDDSPLLTERGQEDEKPLLLDPCKEEDVKLISFMGNNVISVSSDPINAIRVEVSKKVYNLEEPYIRAERAKVWDGVVKIIEEYQSGERSLVSCRRELREISDRNAQFSACAIACINSLAPEILKEDLDLTL